MIIRRKLRGRGAKEFGMVSKIEKSTKRWAKPKLNKLGTLKDVANGSAPGNDSNGNGAANKFS
jgi:hypothetical protein